MKSFSLLRTNPALTTNVKLIIDSEYNLFLESIDSQEELSASRFKKMQFNKDNYYDELVPYFFKEFPVDIAFSVAYDEDSYNMSTDFANQYDERYIAGAKNIENNKGYEEEYEYFAPLYLFKHAIPKYFVIFRVDGPGLTNLSKDNFKAEFLKNFKTVKIFDMTKNSPFGEWVNNNFTINKSFPDSTLDVDFRELEFTRWRGIDYDSGGYTYKSFYLDENLENENTLFDFEKFFTDGYRDNKLIYPQIFNFSFLFDDNPATPTSLRKWSMNRYSGFYLDDMEVIDCISPFKMSPLQSDVRVTAGNVIRSVQFGDPFIDGFKVGEDNWVEYLGKFYKVEQYDRKYSKRVSPIKSKNKRKKLTIDKVDEPIKVEYRIISDIDLTGKQASLNQKHYYIDDQNRIVKASNNAPYSLTGFGFADVNLIEINGKFHNLIEENGYIKLVTDYGFTYNEDYRFEYHINNGVEGFTDYIDLFVTNQNSPNNFKIYRAKFTDIKDFDTQVIDTEYSKFEYEKRNDLSRTEESKMYLTDLRSTSNPPVFDDFVFTGKTEMVPVSSDYTANLETFRINDKKLTELWRKNPTYCRWGYQNSTSTNDYPYLLNNNDIHEKFNRTVDTRNLIPKRETRNLDYFYTINSGTISYLHHSLHIEKNNASQEPSYMFEVDKYLGLADYQIGGQSFSYDFDYFDLFFSPTQSFMDNKILYSKKKHSYFEAGDNAIPNMTVFRGLKFKLFEVDSVVSNTTTIDNINLKTSDMFDDYKFSILLSSNDWEVGDDNVLYKPYYWDEIDSMTGSGTYSIIQTNPPIVTEFSSGDYVELEFPQYQLNTTTMSNIGGGGFQITNPQGPTYSPMDKFRIKMQWDLVQNYDIDILYQEDDLIYWEQVVYRCLNQVTVSDPSISPTQSGDFEVFNTLSYNPFYNYEYPTSYVLNDWVYMYGDYYEHPTIAATISFPQPSTDVNFWNPHYSYGVGSKVIYDNRYFEATDTVPAGVKPLSNNKRQQLSGSKWSEIPEPTNNVRWVKITLWDKNETYGTPEYVVSNNILYQATGTNLTDENVPGIDPDWNRVYSFEPDTNFKYSPYDNPFIKMGEYFYYSKFNMGMSQSGTQSSLMTLDNGIKIYINKKHKNVLVNIAINDNTLKCVQNITDPTKNIERDELYIDPNYRITAANFIRQINDLDTLYGFADHVSYIVIDEDGTVSKYKFGSNIDQLPYFLLCEEADDFEVKRGSLNYSSDTISKNVLKPSRVLENGNIDNLEKINFYNEVPLGVNIENSKDDPKILKNYNQQDNIISDTVFRHSGNYMPVFYDVEMFNRASIYDHGQGLICDLENGCGLIGSWVPTSVCLYETPATTYSCAYNYQNVEFVAFLGATISFNEFGTFSATTVPGATAEVGYQYDSEIQQLSFATSSDLFGLTWSLSFEPDCLGFSMSYTSASFSIYYNFDAIEVERTGCVSPLSMRDGNYIFDTSLSLFGVMKQRLISKVNKTDNLLKLRNNDSFDSIYPMLDEYGYMVVDYFTFKSSWDLQYHFSVDKPILSSVPIQQNIYRTLYINDIIKNYNSQ